MTISEEKKFYDDDGAILEFISSAILKSDGNDSNESSGDMSDSRIYIGISKGSLHLAPILGNTGNIYAANLKPKGN